MTITFLYILTQDKNGCIIIDNKAYWAFQTAIFLVNFLITGDKNTFVRFPQF